MVASGIDILKIKLGRQYGREVLMQNKKMGGTGTLKTAADLELIFCVGELI